MTDLEISKALALAIGWGPQFVIKRSVYQNSPLVICVWKHNPRLDSDWTEFDYRDWNVIGPIAAKYGNFPMRWLDGTWGASMMGCISNADAPQKAIALAVIGAKK